MMGTLCRKLLRDLRVNLIAVALLLGLFQVLWAKVTERILGKLAPLFDALANLGGMTHEQLQERVFEGPGKIMRTIIGGDSIQLDSAMDMLSIGYVHPLMQFVFCIWAVGRASGAIAGEIDRGTMELLLAQPLARSRLVLSHLIVDCLTIPVLCLSLWAGNWIGAWAITPIRAEEPDLKVVMPKQNYLLEFGPFKVRVEDPVSRKPRERSERDTEKLEARLNVRPAEFGRGLVLVAGLIFAMSGVTMWLSSAGRYRWHVLGLAVSVTIVQFLLNVLGQMWDPAAWLRPLTVFYYYQPQQLILTGDWCVTWREWLGDSGLRLPMPVVLFGVGLLGYAMALRTLVRRDLPAPL